MDSLSNIRESDFDSIHGHSMTSKTVSDKIDQPKDLSAQKAANERVARNMFVFTFVWTTLFGAMLHFGDPNTDQFDTVQWVLLLSIVVLYPVFLIEIAVILQNGKPFRKRYLRHLIPPLRVGARDTETWTKIWLPKLGYKIVSRHLRRRVERAVARPMLIVTLLVLPLLLLDFLIFKKYLQGSPGLRTLSAVGETIIWVAFTFEFTVMFCLSDKKVAYCKENWIDLVVIVLPLFAFLRFLRLSRLSRLTKFTRMVNVYRLRGATVRLRRGVMVLELVTRLLQPKTEKRLNKLEMEYEEKEEELENLRIEIEALRHALALKKSEESNSDIDSVS